MPTHVITDSSNLNPLTEGDLAIKWKTITLIDDQIKALPTTPVELVPAPGEGKILIFQSALFYRKIMVAPYTVNEDDGMNICLDNGFFTQQDAAIQQASSFGASDLSFLLTTSPSDDVLVRDPQRTVSHDVVGGQPVMIAQFGASSANKPLTLFGFASDPSWTGGDPANIIKVTVYYSIVDL